MSRCVYETAIMEVTNSLLLSNKKSNFTSFVCHFSVPLKDVKHVSIQYAKLSANAFNLLVGTNNNTIAVNGSSILVPCASYTRAQLAIELQRAFEKQFHSLGVSCQIEFGSSHCDIRLVSGAFFQVYSGNLSRHLGFNPDGVGVRVNRTWDIILDMNSMDASGNVTYASYFHVPHVMRVIGIQKLPDVPTGEILISTRGAPAASYIMNGTEMISISSAVEIDASSLGACYFQFTPREQVNACPRIRITTEHFELTTRYVTQKQYVLRCEQIEAQLYQGVQEMSGICIFMQKPDGDITFEPLIQPTSFINMIPKIDRLTFTLMDTCTQKAVDNKKVDVDVLLKFTLHRKLHDRLAVISHLNPHIQPMYHFDHDLARAFESDYDNDTIHGQ